MNLQEYLHQIDTAESKEELGNLLDDAANDELISDQDYREIRNAVINKSKEEKS